MTAKIMDLPIANLSRLIPSDTNPRVNFSYVKTIADSIKRNGIKERLICRELKDGTIMVDAGNTRLAALHSLPPEHRPAVVPIELRDSSPDERLALHWVTNEERKTLDTWEKVSWVEHKTKAGFKAKALAIEMGLTASAVSGYVFLSKLPQWVKEAGLDGKIATTLCLQLRDEHKADLEAVIGALTPMREEIEAQGVTAERFNFPKSNWKDEVKKAKEEAAKAKKEAEAAKAALETEAKARAAEREQALQNGVNDEQLAAQNAAQNAGAQAIAGLPVPSGDVASHVEVKTEVVGDNKPIDPTTVQAPVAPTAPVQGPSEQPAKLVPTEAPDKHQSEIERLKARMTVQLGRFLDTIAGMQLTLKAQGVSADSKLDRLNGQLKTMQNAIAKLQREEGLTTIA